MTLHILLSCLIMVVINFKGLILRQHSGQSLFWMYITAFVFTYVVNIFIAKLVWSRSNEAWRLNTPQGRSEMEKDLEKLKELETKREQEQ